MSYVCKRIIKLYIFFDATTPNPNSDSLTHVPGVFDWGQPWSHPLASPWFFRPGTLSRSHILSVVVCVILFLLCVCV